MTDIVYVLKGNDSIWQNNEIRYSLRGVDQFLSGVGNVFIIGDCPYFLQNVIHIPATDEEGRKAKDRNIFRKLLMACADISISERFLFMNDDHFIIDRLEASEIPYYYREIDMQKTIDINPKDIAWITSLKNTREWLVQNNHSVKMFDMHTPIIYEKEKLQKLNILDWDKPYGYGIKSLYCNSNNIEGELHKDNRLFTIHRNKISLDIKFANKPFLSTSPIVPQLQRQYIENLYPHKSKYEK